MLIELTKEDEGRLKDMAIQSQCSEAELAREALHWFLHSVDSHSELIARARNDVADGRLVDHDALFKEIEKLIPPQ